MFIGALVLPQGAGVAQPGPPAQGETLQKSLATRAESCGSARCTGAPLTDALERGLRPRDSFRECDDCPEMVVVPTGSFMMGSPDDDKQRGADEGPRHSVTISRPFAVSRTHVTVDQFAAFVRDTGHVAFSACNIYTGSGWEEKGSWRSPGFSQEGTHPVTCLSWKDAKAYIDWLARKTGKPYRLLSEAEWEYAARGQTQPAAYSRFWFGNDDQDLCRYGNGGDQTLHGAEVGKSWTVSSCTDHYVYTAPVAQFEPNGFGLHDMLGQVWQWTADCWHPNFTGAPADGSAWTTGSCDDHVVRGGSWSSAPNYLRTAQRFGGVKYLSVGIRVGRTLSP